MDQSVTISQIDAILKFIPMLEVPEKSKPAVPPEPREDKVLEFPCTDYSPAVGEFWQALRENGFMVNGFKWAEWQGEAERFVERPELLKAADMETLRKLLTVHVRKERFCDGHFAEMIRCGHIKVILGRLQELRTQAETNP